MPTFTNSESHTRIRYGKSRPAYGGDPGPFMDQYLDYPQKVTSRTYPDRRPMPSDPLFNPTSYSHSTIFQKYGTKVSANGLYLELNNPRQSNALNKLLQPDFGVTLRNKVKAQKVNLAQAIAEYGQARTMVQSAVEATHKIWQARRSIKPFEVLDVLAGIKRPTSRLTGYRKGMSTRVLANNHLAYSFGIAPIISDIDGLLAEARDRTTAEFEPFQKRVACIHEDHAVDQVHIPGYTGFSVYDSARSKSTLIMWYELDRLGFLSNLSRFGFLNAAALAWELFPWSFVVDYLFAVGDTISAIDGLTSVGRTSVTVTTRTNVTTTLTPNNGTPSIRMLKYTSRSTQPLPPLLATNKRWFSPNLSFQKTLNLAALLRSTNPTHANWRI